MTDIPVRYVFREDGKEEVRRSFTDIERAATGTKKATDNYERSMHGVDSEQKKVAASGGGVRRSLHDIERQAQQSASQVVRVGGAAKLTGHQMQNLSYQVNDVFMGLATGQRPMQVFLQQGGQIQQVFGAGTGATGILKGFTQATIAMAKPFLPLIAVIGTAAGALKLLNSEISSGAEALALKSKYDEIAKSADEVTAHTVTMGDQMSAAFDLIGEAWDEKVVGNMRGLAPIIGTIMDAALDAVKWFVNGTIGLFDFALTMIGRYWDSLPALMGDIFLQVYNVVVGQMQAVLEAVIYPINKLIELMNKLKPELDLSQLEIDLEKFQAKTSGTMTKITKDVSAEMTRTMSTDYIGGWQDRALKNAGDRLDEFYKDDIEKAAEAAQKKADAEAKIAKRAAERASKEAQRIYEREQERIQKMWQQPFDNAIENIQGNFGDMFSDVFRNGLNGTYDFAGQMKNIFARLAGEIAAMMVIRPIIDGSGMSGSGSGFSFGSSGSGGFGFGDISKVYNAYTSGLNTPIFSADGFIGSGINQVGSYLGYSPGVAAAPSANFIGAMPLEQGTSSALGSQTLNSNFTTGTAIAGIAGNYLGNALFGDDRGIGADIGGTLGGIAGSALAGAAVGASGAAIGATVGSVVPVVGTLIGAVIGNFLGGMIGGGAPSNISEYNGVIGKNGTVGIESIGTKGIDSTAAMSLAGSMGSYFSGLQEQYGFDFSGRKVWGSYNDKRGSSFGLRGDDGSWKHKYGFDPEDAESMQKALAGLTVAMLRTSTAAEGVSNDVRTAAKHIDVQADGLEQAFADLEFAFNFDHMGEAPKVISEVEKAIAQLNATFDQAEQTARRLGLSEEAVNVAREQRMELLGNELLNGSRNALLGNSVGGYSQFLSLQQQYNAALKDFALLNVDTTLLTRNYQMQVQALIAQNNEDQVTLLQQEQERLGVAANLATRYSNIDNIFEDLLYQMEYGRYSPNTPSQNLDELRTLVETVGREAQLGNIDSQERLAQLLPNFLDLSEEVNGANALFAQDLALGNSLATAAQTVAQRQVTIQEEIAASAQEQIKLLQQMVDGGGLTNMDDKYFSGDFQTGYNKAISSGGDPFAALTRARQAGAISGEQQTALAQSAGFYGTSGGGRAWQFFQDNTSASEKLMRLMQQAGLTGYAAGGLVTGGVAGKDSVPIMTMGGEYVLRQSAVRSIGVANVDRMNATGRMPSTNDNGGEVSKLRAEVAHLTNVISRGFSELKEPAAQTAESTARIAASGEQQWRNRRSN